MPPNRLTREESKRIRVAFFYQYNKQPGFNSVCIRYNIWDGDYIEVKVQDLKVVSFPEMYEGLNVFVEQESGRWVNPTLPSA